MSGIKLESRKSVPSGKSVLSPPRSKLSPEPKLDLEGGGYLNGPENFI